MADFESNAREQLDRVLTFLAVSGGAALVSKTSRRMVARCGDIAEALAEAAVQVPLGATDLLVRAAPDAVVCDVGASYRLVVRVGTGLGQDAAFAARVRRARQLLERFVVPHARPPGSVPPGSAPAHAVVFVEPRWRR